MAVCGGINKKTPTKKTGRLLASVLSLILNACASAQSYNPKQDTYPNQWGLKIQTEPSLDACKTNQNRRWEESMKSSERIAEIAMHGRQLELYNQAKADAENTRVEILSDYARVAIGLQYIVEECFNPLVSGASGGDIRVSALICKAASGDNAIRGYSVTINGKSLTDDLAKIFSFEEVIYQFRTSLSRLLLPDSVAREYAINFSIKQYAEPCPCPYSKDFQSLQCGDRSAYTRTGGAEPLCYARDVSLEEIWTWQQSALEQLTTGFGNHRPACVD
jgi:hypothetical protein